MQTFRSIIDFQELKSIMSEETSSLEFTPTWVVAGVCFLIVVVSLLAQRGLRRLGKFLKHSDQDALFEALQKLKEELMLLGFISLVLTAFQGPISKTCVPPNVTTKMLPCKRESEANHNRTSPHGTIHRMLSEATLETRCSKQGKVPLISLEALHQLHIFIFVMALVHVVFCVTTMVLGGARVRKWKKWEDSITRSGKDIPKQAHEHHRHFVKKHAKGYWRKAAVISWSISFFRQFYGSVTKSEYTALRQGFISTHCPRIPKFDFHEYVMRTLEVDFKKIIGISWYLWLFVVAFLLLNLEGWRSFFWLAFLPLIILLLVGAKLVHIISLISQEHAHKSLHDAEAAAVEPSDKYFWFGRPTLVLRLIQFILFQNSFEIAFFFWILFTYGFRSCMMEELGYIVVRLVMGVVVQVVCSYSTLPLYVLVSQMGSSFKKGMFGDNVQSKLDAWVGGLKGRDSPDTSMHGLTMGGASQGEAQEMVPTQASESTITAHEIPHHPS